MPAATIYALAQQRGVTKKRAESLWQRAKKAAVGSKLKGGKTVPEDEDKWSSEHYGYVTGIYKRMLGKQEGLSYAESLVDLALAKGTKTVIEAVSQGDINIRAFFDSGELCFATTEDVLLDDATDPRLALLRGIVNEVSWPEDHPIFDSVDGYEGSLQSLFVEILRVTDLGGSNLTATMEVVDPVSPRRPRKRSLAQKQGARKGGRTRQRRQYAESDGKGFLYYNYYQRHPFVHDPDLEDNEEGLE